MKELFADLTNRGEVVLREFEEQGMQESLTLEFKLKEDSSHGRLSKGDKKNLCKEISAMSNSQGGIIIWGIDASQDSEGVDRVKKLVPISEISKFSSAISNQIGQAIAPVNENIEMHTLKAVSDPSAGYLVIRVGRSERRPHRSEGPQDKQYYKRSGTQSIPMEHFDIEDMFKRTVSPDLSLQYVVRNRGGGSTGGIKYRKMHVLLRLQNNSTTSAFHPYLEIFEFGSCRVAEYGIDGNGGVGLPRRASIDSHLFAGGADHAVHPGQCLDVQALEFIIVNEEFEYVPQELKKRLTRMGEPLFELSAEVSCSFRIGATGMAAKSGTLTVPNIEIVPVFRGERIS